MQNEARIKSTDLKTSVLEEDIEHRLSCSEK